MAWIGLLNIVQEDLQDPTCSSQIRKVFKPSFSAMVENWQKTLKSILQFPPFISSCCKQDSGAVLICYRHFAVLFLIIN